MQLPKDATLLRIFVGESDRWQHQPLSQVIALQARMLALGLSVVLFSWGCERTKEGPSPQKESGWLTNFSQAQERARAEKKVLLLNFTGSDWCPPCLMLHRQVFAQPEFSDYAAQHLVLLEVDFPRTKEQSPEQKEANEKLAERFGIMGFPTIILLDSSGEKIGELGYLRGGPSAFVAALERIRTQEDDR